MTSGICFKNHEQNKEEWMKQKWQCVHCWSQVMGTTLSTFVYVWRFGIKNLKVISWGVSFSPHIHTFFVCFFPFLCLFSLTKVICSCKKCQAIQRAINPLSINKGKNCVMCVSCHLVLMQDTVQHSYVLNLMQLESLSLTQDWKGPFRLFIPIPSLYR